MIMQPLNHPDDERLAALAGADPDVTGDRALREHVASCDRCTSLVADLTTLRSALAELPDLVPSRPLRFLPPALDPAPSFVERLAGWVRRGFAPALVAGAGLVLVGAVGTANTTGILGQAATAGSTAGAAAEDDTAAEQQQPAVLRESGAEEPTESNGLLYMPGGDSMQDGAAPSGAAGGAAQAVPSSDETSRTFDASVGSSGPERSPWPMVLFSGAALLVAAFALRWILQPRAG